MIEVTILSRPDCHLCNVALKIARSVQREIPFIIRRVNVDDDPHLSTACGSRIPVILIDQIEYFSGKVTEGELRWAIKKARWRRRVSRILSRLSAMLKRG